MPFLMRALLSGATEIDRVTGTYRSTGGNVVIRCDDITLYADEVEWSDKDQIVKARGRVTFEQPGVRITADRVELDNTTKLGVFYGADGTAKISRRGSEPRSLFGTQEPEVHFWAERLARVADKRYEIENGGFSTCIQPTERWTISGSSLTVVLDDSTRRTTWSRPRLESRARGTDGSTAICRSRARHDPLNAVAIDAPDAAGAAGHRAGAVDAERRRIRRARRHGHARVVRRGVRVRPIKC